MAQSCVALPFYFFFILHDHHFPGRASVGESLRDQQMTKSGDSTSKEIDDKI